MRKICKTIHFGYLFACFKSKTNYINGIISRIFGTKIKSTQTKRFNYQIEYMRQFVKKETEYLQESAIFLNKLNN